MNTLIRVAVFIAALIPFAEMISIAATAKAGTSAGDFILRYSATWALNFLVFSLAIAPAIRLTGLRMLASLQNMMGLFVFLYATLHIVVWFFADLNAHWLIAGQRVVLDPALLAGVAAYLLVLPLLLNSSYFIHELLGPFSGMIGKLVIPAVIFSMLHFFLVASGDRTMPGVYAGVFLTLMGYRAKAGVIPRSVPALISRFLRK